MGKSVRNSFAVSSVFRFSALIVCVGSDISSSWSSSTVRDGSAIEVRASMKPCCVRASVARDVESFACVWWHANH